MKKKLWWIGTSLMITLTVGVQAATIGSTNDLTSLGNGVYQINFQGTPNRGFVTSNNSTLAPLWYARAKYKFGSDWDWGYSEYENSDGRYLANNKFFRLWNPGDTKENCYVEFSARDGNGTFKFAIEGSGEKTIYFGGNNWKDVLKAGTEHTFEFEFQENSYFKMWHNGTLLATLTNFNSNSTGLGKRVYILGLENEWNSGTKRAPNTLTLSDIVMTENKTRTQTPLPGSSPTPTPVVATPTPTTPMPLPTVSGTAAESIPNWFINFIKKFIEFLTGWAK